jgi:membrane-bound inhibitor of C-type lysozyme
MIRALIVICVINALSIVPAMATETSLQLVIKLTEDAERRLVKYQCEGQDEPLEVEYLNAAPNYLAILTVDSQRLIFANIVSGSGVQYVAGQYIWQTKAAEGILLFKDGVAEPTVQLTCLEENIGP